VRERVFSLHYAPNDYSASGQRVGRSKETACSTSALVRSRRAMNKSPTGRSGETRGPPPSAEPREIRIATENGRKDTYITRGEGLLLLPVGNGSIRAREAPHGGVHERWQCSKKMRLRIDITEHYIQNCSFMRAWYKNVT